MVRQQTARHERRQDMTNDGVENIMNFLIHRQGRVYG